MGMTTEKREQFLEAYNKYGDALYRHCFFRVYSRARAEEIMQEAYMKVYHYMHDNIVLNLRALLYRVANNLIIDESRKHKEESLDKLMDIYEGFGPSKDDRSDTERKMALKDIHRNFTLLNPEEQSLLRMRYVEDMDPKEIAEILRISANNVSVKINRAIGKLKKVIGGAEAKKKRVSKRG